MRSEKKLKAIQLVLSIVLVLIGAVPSAFAQYSDWNLTVYPVNVNWGDSSITVTVKGPYGWQQTQTINNGPNPYATFVISGNDVPPNTQYRVCI
jgi:hypothetical protein